MSPLRLARRAWSRRPLWPTPADRFHSVRDYRRLVRRLLADHPYEQAMSLAVGGEYETMGESLASAMTSWGDLRDGMSLLDLGCGSGRLAHVLARRMDIQYQGLDVVPELLSYAKRRCPASYRFALNLSYRLPAPDASVDRVAAFSVFTHLLHEESFLYLREARRVLKPDGLILFSFLEFGDPGQWPLFMHFVDAAASGVRGPINVFLEESVIRRWADRLAFESPAFIRELGQSVAVLRRPTSE